MKKLLGKPVADKILSELTNGSLAVLSADKNAASSSYIKGIVKGAQKCNTEVNFYNLDVLDEPDKITERGILVLTPLPKNLNKEDIISKIPSCKDVDGAGKYADFYPCTAEAIIEILDYYNIGISGKNICVVGRSKIVGLPVAKLLLKRDATVCVCHSKTKNLLEHTKRADIVICAIGSPQFFTQKYFNENQIIIDAGINWDSKNNKLCGDCDTDIKCMGKTPVPGGVGSVTSAVLLKHCCTV